MKRVVVAVTVVGTAIAGTVGSAVAARSGEALPRTTVAGIDVGGLGPADVQRTVADEARSRTTGTITVLAADQRLEVTREALGTRVDLERTAERAVDAGRGSVLDVVLGSVRDRGRDVELEVQVDEPKLDGEVRALVDQVAREPEPGGFTVLGTTVTTRPPQAGRRLDPAAARAALLEAVRRGGADVRLEVEELDPGTLPGQAEQVAGAARRALAAPYELTSTDATVTVAPSELAPLLSARADGGQLELAIDTARLRQLVTAQARSIDRTARSAGFEVSPPPLVDAKGTVQWQPQPAQVRVTPGAPGRQVDVAAATRALVRLVSSDARADALPLQTTQPALTTEQAERAGVRAVIGTFTSSYQPGQPRARNIRRIAEIVDGTYLAPGESFSLNGTAGRRTLERGFVKDSAIIDGQLEDVVGGGVSQFATTIFNAAFFAGLPIAQHKPHSFYISRYPPGRESTVNFGSIDVQFRNDTGAGVWVDTSTTGSSVTVALYGDNGGRRVEALHGPQVPRPGGGFVIEVTRVVSGGDGRGGRRVFRTTYNAPPAD